LIAQLAYPIALTLVLPKISESAGRKFGIADGMLYVLVAEIELNRTSILAGIREIETRRMPKHMRMDWKPDAGRLGGFGDYVMNRTSGHRTTSQ
jgi:hypothetical protein